MALQRAKLSDIQFISTSAGIAYSNPAGVKTYIRGIIIMGVLELQVLVINLWRLL